MIAFTCSSQNRKMLKSHPFILIELPQEFHNITPSTIFLTENSSNRTEQEKNGQRYAGTADEDGTGKEPKLAPCRIENGERPGVQSFIVLCGLGLN